MCGILWCFHKFIPSRGNQSVSSRPFTMCSRVVLLNNLTSSQVSISFVVNDRLIIKKINCRKNYELKNIHLKISEKLP